jgi:hypothetical protein
MTWPAVRTLLGEPYTTYRDQGATVREWLTAPSTFDCWTLTIRFVGGRVAESYEGQT